LKYLQELDEAWQIRSIIPFNQRVLELRRLVYLAYCEEFVTTKKSVKFQINNNEFWLVPSSKAAKYLKTSLPTIIGTEMMELLIDHHPDVKTLNIIFSVKKELAGKIEPNLP
jgi:hypothetical protein